MHFGDLVNIDKAISVHEQAVHLTPEGHSNKPACLKNLGNSFADLFKCSGDLVDRSATITCYHCNATYPTGSPLIQFNAAVEWVYLAFT